MAYRPGVPRGAGLAPAPLGALLARRRHKRERGRQAQLAVLAALVVEVDRRRLRGLAGGSRTQSRSCGGERREWAARPVLGYWVVS